MNNSTRLYNSCQDIPQYSKSITSDPRAFLSKHLIRSDFNVLRHLYSACNKYGNNTYPSQETIAKVTGYCRKTVNESVGRLRNLGIISTITRYKRTCLYRMPDYFFTDSMRKKLSSFFRYYVFFAVSLLVPKPGVTQVKLDVYLELNPNPHIRESINYAHDARARGEQKNEDWTHLNRSRVLEASGRLVKLQEKFPITTHGIIKLSIFPEEAIDEAENQLSAVFRAGDPYAYFFKLCKNYCVANGIELEWKKYFRLRIATGVNDSDPVLDMDLFKEIKSQQKPEPTKRNYNKKEFPKQVDNTPPETKAFFKAQHEDIQRSLADKQEKLKTFYEENDTNFKILLSHERAMHSAIISNRLSSDIFGVPPRWNSITDNEKKDILEQAHPNCSCRTREKIALGLITEQPVEQSIRPMAQYMDKIISRAPIFEPVCAKPDIVVTKHTEFDYLDESAGYLVDAWE